MRYEVILPGMGDETAEEATVTFWLVEEGEQVDEGTELLELTTDKAAFTLPSPRRGKLIEKRVEAGEEVRVGEPLCVLEV